MNIPSHYYHPFFVHLPLVLPFVCLFLFVLKRETLFSIQRELFLLFGLQVAFALLTFYSGQWASDGVLQRVTAEARNQIEWHSLYGRLVLFQSAMAGILGSVAIIATERKRVFYGIAVFALGVLCILVLLSGRTGGSLIYDFQINVSSVHDLLP